jgi:uncharacterized protein with PQ loop repeat
MFTVCYVPQVIKTVRSGTVDGVSVSLFVIQFLANIVALVYALMIDQPALIVKYALALVLVGAVLMAIYQTIRKH